MSRPAAALRVAAGRIRAIKTGWYGALYEGMTGDGSILVTKAILDGVTACIFGTLLG